MKYEDFKKQTIEATDAAKRAKDMRLISDEEYDGFSKAMWEAREIFMRLEAKSEELENGSQKA